MEGIRNLGLDMECCRGQGYDGAGNMSGKCQGAASLIQNDYHRAIYVHCAAHRLSLCVTNSCKIIQVKNRMATVKSTSDFFNNSPKRQLVSEQNIEQLCRKGRLQKKLIDACCTRWIERIKGLQKHCEMFKAIMTTLEEIKDNHEGHWNSDTCSEANGLFPANSEFQFIICLIVVREIFFYIKPATKKLQRTETDIVKAYSEIMDLRNTFDNNVRENIDEYHSKWFNDATQLAATVDAEAKMPRTCKRQTLKENHPADTALDYYRRMITSQFLDHMITQLDTRFQALAMTEVINGFIVIPKMMVDHIKKQGKASWNDTFTTFAKDFDNDLSNLGGLKAEMDIWENYWGPQCKGNLPDRVSTTLSVIENDTSYYPFITASTWHYPCYYMSM